MPRFLAIAVLMVSLLSAAAVAQNDEWEQVPAEPGPAETGKINIPGPSGTPDAGTGCGMVGAFAQEAAKLRDAGVSEETQLASIDKPGGKLYRLTERAALSADTRSEVRAAIHSEIAYVYKHREMTPAQLGTQARANCGGTR
jgi:hypothetical protein